MPGVRWVRGIRGSLYLWDPSTALTRELVVTGAFEVVDGERRTGVGVGGLSGGGGGWGREIFTALTVPLTLVCVCVFVHRPCDYLVVCVCVGVCASKGGGIRATEGLVVVVGVYEVPAMI